MVEVKYNRGPMAGKREVRPDLGMVRVVAPIDIRRMFRGEITEDTYKEGSYIRSNVTLKDGTVVYEWMGWKN